MSAMEGLPLLQTIDFLLVEMESITIDIQIIETMAILTQTMDEVAAEGQKMDGSEEIHSEG